MQIKDFILGPIGTNCYLVTDEQTKETAIIDPADCTTRLRDYIAEEKLIPKYIVLTHGHCDHTGGIARIMKEYPEIQLAACRDELTVLNNPAYNYSRDIYGKVETFEPDVLLIDGDKLFIGETALTVIATPGHTIGGISLLAENALFSGDTLFADSVGRTDLPTGDFGVLEKSIKERLYVLPDDTEVYPGHMGQTTIGHEKRYNSIVRP